MPTTPAPNSVLDPFAAFLDLSCLGPSRENAAALARMLLACPEHDGAGRSSLNNDGVPLQLCVSLSGARRKCRLIADPASSVDDAEDRFARGRAALASLLAARGPLLQDVCDRTLAATLPPASGRAALSTGAMWLAAGIDEPGLALYTTADWGPRDHRWDRALAWLDELLPNTETARRCIEPLPRLARLVAHAVEGDTPSRARAKLYLRLHDPVPLINTGLDLLFDQRLAGLLVRLFDKAPIRSGSLVCSLGFDLADGELSDQKMDICAHCVSRTPAEWKALLDWWTKLHGLPDFDCDEAILTGAAEVAFVGLGIDARGGMRTNLYLKPPAPTVAAPSR